MLVTDGITDPLGTASSPLGQAGLLAELSRARPSAESICAALLRATTPIEHDATVVVLKLPPPPPPRDARPRAALARARRPPSCAALAITATSSAARSYSAEWVTRASTSVPGARRRGVGRQRQVDLAVDLGRLSFVAAHRQVFGLVGRALDQHAQHAAAHGAQLLLRHLALDAQQLAAAGVDLFLRDALRQQRGDGAFLAREVEHADVVQLGLAHEVAQPLEGGVGLARVAGDERRAQRAARHASRGSAPPDRAPASRRTRGAST